MNCIIFQQDTLKLSPEYVSFDTRYTSEDHQDHSNTDTFIKTLLQQSNVSTIPIFAAIPFQMSLLYVDCSGLLAEAT